MRRVVDKLNFTGATQTFLVPFGVTQVFIQIWGAAGGSQGGRGGAGGYSQGTLLVQEGHVLDVIVGQGGINFGTSQANCLLPTFGGGGGGGTSTEVFRGSSGGGRTAVLDNSNIEVITAGGGGGSSSSYSEGGGIAAGSGGGTVGFSALANLVCYDSMMGKGGTQSAGGAGGVGWTAFNNGGAGTQFRGGTGGGGSNGGSSAGAAGGGGGGFFGGGGGAGSFQAGLGCPPSASSQDVSGGGGSGFIGGVLQALTLATTISRTSFPATVNPPNNTDPNYVTGIGVAAAGVGGNGLAVFTYTLPTLIKSVDKNFATIGDVINYTLVLDNPGPVTFNNVLFVDTIPNGTTFNSNSLIVNGNPIAGSPNPPGISIGTYTTNITINFSVTVTTIPVPNPITNTGTVAVGTNIYASNTVTTNINYLNITNSKTVSRVFANVGDILTYTIPIRNNGNTTAISINFIDTIPNGTSLVTGSFRQDNTAISGIPNSPGVTLPNSTLGVNRVTTVSFQVRVNTIPNPNPIQNSATVKGTFIVDATTSPNTLSSIQANTNIVNTQINNANLNNVLKLVDKSYADCGDSATCS